MTIVSFGSGDILALPKLNISQSSFGSDVHYTHPSYVSFYSKYGFAVPLNYEAIPYDIIMDNKLPNLSPHVKRFENNCDYLFVGHDGILWKISLSIREDGHVLSQSYIERKTMPGWWVGVNPAVLNADGSKLIGFLYTNPTQEQINEYFITYHAGERISWHSISEIVETLHREFPLEERAPNE